MASKTVKQFIMVGSGEYSSKELSGTQLRHQQANNVHKDEALDCFWTFTEIISFMIPVPGMSCRWQYFVLQFPKCHLWGSALSAPFFSPPPLMCCSRFLTLQTAEGPRELLWPKYSYKSSILYTRFDFYVMSITRYNIKDTSNIGICMVSGGISPCNQKKKLHWLVCLQHANRKPKT